MMLKRLSGIFISFLIATTAHAQGTIPKAAEADSVAPESRKGLVNRVIDYFSSSNKTRTDKKFDFSILGGPHYSSDSKFGIGIVAAGVYNTDPADSAWLRPSNVSIYGDATTAAHFKLGVRGVNIWPADSPTTWLSTPSRQITGASVTTNAPMMRTKANTDISRPK